MDLEDVCIYTMTEFSILLSSPPFSLFFASTFFFSFQRGTLHIDDR